MPVTTITQSEATSLPTGPRGTRGSGALSWGEGGQSRYERPFVPGRNRSRGHHEWETGDIAFLIPEDHFPDEERNQLITPKRGRKHGYIPEKATGHPVIILDRLSRQSTHVLITTVSAYHSGPENNYEAPWNQRWHEWKDPKDFRSFHGCEKYDERWPALHLRDGKSMPKPKTCKYPCSKYSPKRNPQLTSGIAWLNIQSVWVVPLTVIGTFTKSRDLLRVRPDSIQSLKEHMELSCKGWKEAIEDLYSEEPEGSGCQRKEFPHRNLASWRSGVRGSTSPYHSGERSPAPQPARGLARESTVGGSNVVGGAIPYRPLCRRPAQRPREETPSPAALQPTPIRGSGAGAATPAPAKKAAPVSAPIKWSRIAATTPSPAQGGLVNTRLGAACDLTRMGTDTAAL